jgi:hypothetical protein
VARGGAGGPASRHAVRLCFGVFGCSAPNGRRW